MKLLQNIEVPTGNIMVVEGEKGSLELVSLGDYGKEVNLKCDALGLTRKPERVRHTSLMPLEKKWVVTISTQYGCSMGCKFCDVPKVGAGKNVSVVDLIGQIDIGVSLHPEVEVCNRLNIHFARMGEPTWNMNVLSAAMLLLTYDRQRFRIIHPVVSTMMPRHNRKLEDFLYGWMRIKNDMYVGNAGLQLSINSTDDDERREMFGGSALPLDSIGNMMGRMPFPRGRKITLNFAVANYEIDPSVLLKYFDPEKYIIKLTPMHRTSSALQNNIETEGDYTTFAPYEHYEKALKEAGYDVLVFIASREEDEGLITCGNAVLSGSIPHGAGVL